METTEIIYTTVEKIEAMMIADAKEYVNELSDWLKREKAGHTNFRRPELAGMDLSVKIPGAVVRVMNDIQGDDDENGYHTIIITKGANPVEVDQFDPAASVAEFHKYPGPGWLANDIDLLMTSAFDLAREKGVEHENRKFKQAIATIRELFVL